MSNNRHNKNLFGGQILAMRIVSPKVRSKVYLVLIMLFMTSWPP